MNFLAIALFSSCVILVSGKQRSNLSSSTDAIIKTKNNNNCKFAPGSWITNGTTIQSEPGCLFWDQEWDISDFVENELIITYKYLAECKCSGAGKVYCDSPCHESDCV